MTKTPEKPSHSEPATIVSVNAKDKTLVDLWEVSVNLETNLHEGFQLSSGVSPEVAEEICEKRGGEIKHLDSAFDI
jgi:hypothetical protein